MLTFTCTINLPPDHVTLHLAGWHWHLDQLALALDGQKIDWTRWTADHHGRWSEHRDRYAAMLADRH